MPIRDEPWPHGTPGLLTLTCPDPRGTAELYANLFAWELSAGGHPVVASVLGRPVALFLLDTAADDAEAQPLEWTTHLVVDDIYVAMATARGAGATMSDPVDVPGHGRMTLGADPVGARLGLWEPTDPSTPVAEPGTLLWSELLVRDVPTAYRFYEILLDAQFEDVDEHASYATMHTRDGELVAAISDIGPEHDDVPAHWMPYLDTDDIDETVEMAVMFGAQPLLGPDDGEMGRIAILQGPDGELVGLLEIAPEDDDAEEPTDADAEHTDEGRDDAVETSPDDEDDAKAGA